MENIHFVYSLLSIVILIDILFIIKKKRNLKNFELENFKTSKVFKIIFFSKFFSKSVGH